MRLRTTVAIAIRCGLVGGRHLRVGKLAFADWLRLDVFFAEHFRDGAERRDSILKIRNVQKARLLESDIDEGGLHPGQHPRDLAFVDIPGEADLPVSLEVEFGELIIFEHRHPHLQRGSVNCNFSFHK